MIVTFIDSWFNLYHHLQAIFTKPHFLDKRNWGFLSKVITVVQGPAGGQVSELVWNLDLSSQKSFLLNTCTVLCWSRGHGPLQGKGLTVRLFNMPNLRDFNAIKNGLQSRERVSWRRPEGCHQEMAEALQIEQSARGRSPQHGGQI